MGLGGVGLAAIFGGGVLMTFTGTALLFGQAPFGSPPCKEKSEMSAATASCWQKDHPKALGKSSRSSG